MYVSSLLQKYEELSSSNGPVSVEDIKDEPVISLVDAAVTAVLTRLESKLITWLEMYQCVV